MTKKKSSRKIPKRRKNARPTSRSNSIFSDLPELGLPRKLWSQNKRIEAAALFEKIVQSQPANIPALIDASRAMGSLYQHQRAEEYLERAIEVGVASAKTMQLAGQSYRLMRRNDQAIACFQAALKIDGQRSDTHLELAILHERNNRLDAALNHCESRLKLIPQDGESRFIKGRILRRKEQFEQAEKLLTEVASDRTVHWLTRGRSYADLAKLLDQTQEYERAWDAVLTGKKIFEEHATPDYRHRAEVVPPLNRLAKTVSATDIEDWETNSPSAMTATPRPLLLTGLPRSGTTLLGKILDGHPDIILADEFDLFSSLLFPMLLGSQTPAELSPTELSKIPADRIGVLQKNYRDFFASAIPQSHDSRFLIDKNPSLLPLLTPYVRVFPTDKKIIMLRDPRDVLISCLMEYMPLNDFSIDFLRLPSAVARIQSDLEIWLVLREKLPSGSWIEVKYEDLVENFQMQTKRVLAFLDIEWSDQLNHFPQLESQLPIYSPSYGEVAQPIYEGAIGRWRNYQQQLAAHLPFLDELALKLGY